MSARPVAGPMNAVRVLAIVLLLALPAAAHASVAPAAGHNQGWAVSGDVTVIDVSFFARGDPLAPQVIIDYTCSFVAWPSTPVTCTLYGKGAVIATDSYSVGPAGARDSIAYTDDYAPEDISVCASAASTGLVVCAYPLV